MLTLTWTFAVCVQLIDLSLKSLGGPSVHLPDSEKDSDQNTKGGKEADSEVPQTLWVRRPLAHHRSNQKNRKARH